MFDYVVRVLEDMAEHYLPASSILFIAVLGFGVLAGKNWHDNHEETVALVVAISCISVGIVGILVMLLLSV